MRRERTQQLKRDGNDAEDGVEPESTIDYINEIGQAKLQFSQEMYTVELLAGYSIAAKISNQDL